MSWKLKAALGLALALASGRAFAGAAPLTQTAADFVAAAKTGLSAEIAVLDGGDLTHALKLASRRGVALRLVLDPSERRTRSEGRGLLDAFQSLSPVPTAKLELRWAKGAGRGQRRMLADKARLLAWRSGETPRREDAQASAFSHRFEGRWIKADAALSEALALDDDLQALPDPRESEPHIKKRREGSGE